MPIDLTLHRINILLSVLPRYTRRTLHVAGTNGKGSVTAYLSHILGAASYTVGRFNSPHLVNIWDSITINNMPVAQNYYEHIRSRVAEADASKNIGCSNFEILTATALQIFEELQVEVAVIEVGMGGRLDATNAIPDDCILASAITSVDIDHQQFLGNNVSDIAREKAGIARPGKFLVLGRQKHPETKQAVSEVVLTRSATLVDAIDVQSGDQGPHAANRGASNDWQAFLPGINIPIKGILPLSGAFQLDNLAVALTLLDCISESSVRKNSGSFRLYNITAAAIIKGIQETRWPGRLQFTTLTIPSLKNETTASKSRKLHLLLDGAHNPSASILLSEFLDSLERIQSSNAPASHVAAKLKPRRFIISLSHSPPKTPFAVFSPLLRPGDVVGIAPFGLVDGMPWIRPVDPNELARVAEDLVGETGAVKVFSDVSEALSGISMPIEGLAWSEGDLIVVAGSLYLVADALRYQRSLERVIPES